MSVLCHTWSKTLKFFSRQDIVLQELRHLVVLEVESEYNEKLVRLKAERDRLKKAKQLESEAPPRGRQDGSSDS